MTDEQISKDFAQVLYVWFAENKGTERDGEQFIRAWTHDPARVDGLRNAIGKEPTIYSAILQAGTRDAPADQESKCNCSVHLMSRTDVRHAADCPARAPKAQQSDAQSVRDALEAWAMNFYGCEREHVDHFAGVDGYVIWQASRGQP